MIKHAISLSSVLAIALLSIGCQATAVITFSREQAIARANQDAKQSAPEVGIQQVRIDNVTAESITLAEADQRIGVQRGPGVYAPGQTPQSPVWWVVVRGYFRYEGMGAPPDAAPICEADERDFIYDAQTGESVGGHMPNTRCDLSQAPGTRAPVVPTPTPSASVVSHSPWAGIPAVNNPSHSDQPLPDAIVNGDIIECDLLWFIWENTKSRIWFPVTAPADVLFNNPYYSDLVNGPDVTGRLIGRINPTNGWYIIGTTTQDWKEAQQIYIVDQAQRIKYPLRHKKVSASECLAIPTAEGIQYDPVVETP